jgi:hypothetical protein
MTLNAFAKSLENAERIVRNVGLVITKSDKLALDEDPETGDFVRLLVPKSIEEQRGQAHWVCEQVEEGCLSQHRQRRTPLAISVYVARDKLGLNWETALPDRPMSPDWEPGYDSSGIPELCHYLATLVREHGVRLKKLWPHKRLQAIQRKLLDASNQAGKRLRDLRTAIGDQRRNLLEGEKTAAEDAADFAAGRVRRCLKSWHIDDLEQFNLNRQAAQRDLQAVLQKAVRRAVRGIVRPILGRALREMDVALNQFAQNSEFEMGLRQETRQQTYTTPHIPAAVGRAAGGVSGAIAGGAVGSFFGPLGMAIGGFLGGVFGGFAGGEIGPMVWKETRTVEIPTGTNADEVICQTQQAIRRQAENAVADGFRRLYDTIFAPLDRELSRLESEVSEWPLKG